MADTVETAIYRMSYQTGDATQQLNAVNKAQAATVAGAEQLSVAEEKVTRATRSTADGMTRMLAQLDKRIASEQRLQKTVEQINRLQNEGIGTTTQAARAIELAEEKHRKFVAANEASAAGIGKFSGALGIANGFLGAFGVALSVGAVIQFGRQIFDSVSALSEQAEQIGVSVEGLQAYRAELAQYGVDQQSADTILQRFTRTLGDAQQGIGKGNDAFLQLGLTTRDLAGGPEAALPKIATALLGVRDATLRASLETEIFGKAGQRLESALEAIAVDADKLIEKGKGLGLVLSKEVAKGYDDAGDKALRYLTILKNLIATAAYYGTIAVSSGSAGIIVDEVKRRADEAAARNAPHLPFANDSTQAIADASFNADYINKSIVDDYKANGPEFARITQERIAAEKKSRDEVIDAIKQFKRDADDAWSAFETKKFETEQKIEDGILEHYSKMAQAMQKAEADAEIELANQQPFILGFNITKGPVAEQREKDLEALKREQKQAAGEAQHYWERMFDGAFHDGVNFFDRWFETGEAKLSDFFGMFRKMFSQMLADLAMQALARPILVPVIEGMSGAFGGNASLLQTGASLANGGGLGFPGSLAVTPSVLTGRYSDGSMFGSAVGGPGFMNAPLWGAGGILGGSGAASSLTLAGIAQSAGMAALIAQGGITVGHALGGKGQTSDIVSALTGGLLGSLFHQEPSNYTAWANLNPDLTRGTGPIGDKPNQQTTALADAAGKALMDAAKALKDAGIDLHSTVQRLEIGQRDQTRLRLANGTAVTVGAAGNAEEAVKGTLAYLLKTATSTDEVTQKIIDSYRNAGKLTSQYTDSLLEDVQTVKGLMQLVGDDKQLTQAEQALKQINDQFGAAIEKFHTLGIDASSLVDAQQRAIASLVKGFNDANQSAIDQIVNPVLASWKQLLEAQTDREKEAQALGADTTLLQRRAGLEQQQFLMQLDASQRRALESLIGLSDTLADKLANAQSTAIDAVTKEIDIARQFSQDMRRAATDYANAAASIEKARGAFLVGPLSPLNPLGQYAASRSQLQDLFTKGQGGDVSALNGLSQAVQTFLTQSLNVNAATKSYGSDFDFAQHLLGDASGLAGSFSASALSQADVSGKQLTVLDDIRTALTKPSPDAAYLQTQIDLLGDQNVALNSLVAITQQNANANNANAAAISELRSALSQLQRVILEAA